MSVGKNRALPRSINSVFELDDSSAERWAYLGILVLLSLVFAPSVASAQSDWKNPTGYQIASCSGNFLPADSQEMGPLRVGEDRVEELTSTGQVHRFEIHEAGQRSFLRVRDLTGNGDLDLCLRLESSEPEVRRSVSAGRESTLTFSRTSDEETFTAYVWSAKGTAGSYVLLHDDEFLGPARPVRFGGHVVGSLTNRAERDRYQFQGRRGEVVSLVAHVPTPDGPRRQPLAEIFAKDPRTGEFSLLVEGWQSDTFAVNETLPYDGEYRVFVGDHIGATGPYILCLERFGDREGVQAHGEPSIRPLFASYPGGGNHRLGRSAYAQSATSDGVAGDEAEPSEEVVFLWYPKDGEEAQVVRAQTGVPFLLARGKSLGVQGLARLSDSLTGTLQVVLETIDMVTGTRIKELGSQSLEIGESATVEGAGLDEGARLELVDVAPDTGADGGERADGSSGLCCVTCGGDTLCGCAVKAGCGSCCAGCCGSWAK